MSIKGICGGVLAVLICSVGVSAQSRAQLQRAAQADAEYNRSRLESEAPAPAPQTEASQWANWPYVALCIACAGVAEKVRQRRRENAWQRELPTEGSFAPLMKVPDEPSEQSFQPMTAADMLIFTRPSAAARAPESHPPR